MLVGGDGTHIVEMAVGLQHKVTVHSDTYARISPVSDRGPMEHSPEFARMLAAKLSDEVEKMPVSLSSSDIVNFVQTVDDHVGQIRAALWTTRNDASIGK